MKIHLSKTTYTTKEVNFIIGRLKIAFEKGYLEKKTENNSHLLASYNGVEKKGITPKWNVKIYKYNPKREGHSLNSVDQFVLKKLIEQDYDSFIPPNLPVLRIDDAGWGFPLCGIMVGISNEQEVKSAIVPIEYFRKDTKHHFNTKKYLVKYADLAIELLDQFKATPETHRIEICTGHVNHSLRDRLREKGYDVRVVEIKGMLQEKLENIFKKHVITDIGADLYYDPKEIKKSDIAKMYWKSVKYGIKNCPDKIKTGWNALHWVKN